MNSANFLSTNEDLRLNQYLTTKKKKKSNFLPNKQQVENKKFRKNLCRLNNEYEL